MTMPNQVSATPHTALPERRRERTPVASDDRQHAGLLRRARRVLGTVLFGSRHAGELNAARRRATFDPAAATLAQRITGSGSGPYSGTPFLPASDDAGRTRTAGEPSEAARHDHGIIDHSRHVSSIGRR